MLDHSCQVQRHPLSERGHDLYETPAVATQALIRVEPLPQCIWEPACGRGAIADVLREAGHAVLATDLIDYKGNAPGFDFLSCKNALLSCIVTNPPFKLAEEFVAHAVHGLKVPKVVMLLRLAFLESERRSHILEECGLARVLVFRKRLPMMHRDGWQGEKASSAMAFAWFVWERGYGKGKTTVERISW